MSLHGPDYTILISDRRLSANGRTIEDESNKATSIALQDARLLAAFTGLAQSNRYRTEDWLVDALGECAPPDYLSLSTLQRLRDSISRNFLDDPDIAHLPPETKRLAILFAGFHYDSGKAYPVSAILTNFAGFAGPGDLPRSPDDFVLREVKMDQATRVGFIGAWQSVSGDDIQSLNKMLFEGKKAGAVLGKAVDLFHEIGVRPSSLGTIGGQLSSIVLNADPRLPIESNYHVLRSSPIVYSPNHVVLTRSQQLLTKGGTIYASDTNGAPLRNAPPMAVPKVQRNAPCPCGSRLRYRKCHGRVVRPNS